MRISESVLILTNTMSALLRFMMYSIPDIRLIFFPAPDLALMKQAASCLIGKHDFQSFSPVRKKRDKKELLYLDFIQNKEQLSFRLTANAFLPSMPQLIVGTLLEIGRGKRSPDCILSIFEGNETPGNFCPSDGLFLTEIQY